LETLESILYSRTSHSLFIYLITFTFLHVFLLFYVTILLLFITCNSLLFSQILFNRKSVLDALHVLTTNDQQKME